MATSRRVLGWLGWTLVGLLLLVALLVILARHLLPVVAEYREEVADLLSQRLGVPLEIGALEADWSGRWPRLELTDVRAYSESDAGPEIRSRLAHLSLQFDLLQSLRHLAPVFSQAEVEGLELIWRQRAGRWLHRPRGGDVGDGLQPDAWGRVLGLVMLQPEVSIRATTLTLVTEQGEPRRLDAPELLLRNSSIEHQLSGRVDLKTAVDAGQLRFAVETRELPSDLLAADYDFYLSLDDIGPELPNLADLPVELKSLSLGTEVWGRLSGGRLDYLNGHLELARLETGDARIPPVGNGTADFALLKRDQGYQLQLNHVGFDSAGERLDVDQLILDGDWTDGTLRPQALSMPQLDLGALGSWLQAQPFMPQTLGRVLERLAPQGKLRNLRVDLPPEGGPANFRLVGDLDKVALEAGWGAPRVTGVDGRLEATSAGGRLHLTSDDFELFFPNLYDEGWHYHNADGLVRWSLQPDGILIGSELLHLSNDSVNGAGRFSLTMPFDREQQTELTLMIGMTDSDGRQTGRYVPPKLAGRELHRWLVDSIREGHLKTGGLLLHTGTRNLESGRNSTVQMFFDVDQVQLAYQPDWPAVQDGRAFVLLRDRALLVEIERGRLLDSTIDHARVYLEEPGVPLRVTGSVEGQAGDVLRLLLESPLRDVVGTELARWQLTGTARTEVELGIPLGGSPRPQPRVSVASRLSDGQLASAEHRLDFAALNGDIFYSTARGLRSSNLGGRFFGEPVSALIRTTGADPVRTRIEVTGQLPVSELARWSGVDLLASLTGRSAYNARLELCARGDDCNRLVVNTDLRGVAVPWPTPLGKPGNQSRALQVMLDLNSSQLRFNYDQTLRAVFALDGGPLRGRLAFGGARPEMPAVDGLWLDGQIDAVDAEQVQALFQAQGWIGNDSAPAAPQAAQPGPLRDVNLSIGHLTLGEQRFDGVDLHLAFDPWRLEVASPQLDGALEWPRAAGQPYQLLLQRLQLPEPASDGSGVKAPAGDPVDLSAVPAVDVRIEKLSLGERPFGSWQVALRPEAQRLRFDNLEGRVGGVTISGNGVWQEIPRTTAIDLGLDGKDLGDLLAPWGNGRFIESGKAQGYARLNWGDQPWRFALAKASGELEFQLENGRIIESGSASNLLRIFGILNLNSLARRLKLDFSDLLQSGLAFDSLTGRYRLDQGRAQTLEPLRLKGPSANMTMTGTLDAASETVDQEMEVTLPLTSNIPLAAILLGAPQVAGAVFLIDKLIGDQIEKVTAIRYQLSGNWDNPEVSVVRTAPPKERILPGDR